MTEAIILFIAGLLLLIKGGDWFVEGASRIAARFRIPEIVIGATVVSIGTTLPEVMVSVSAALAGQGSMAYGNAIGSIICNTALIAALTVAIKPAPIETKSLKIPTLVFFLSTAIYVVSAYVFGYFYRWIGFLLLATFAAYMFLTVRSGLKNRNSEADKHEKAPEIDTKKKSLVWEIVMLVLGAALIAVGADLLVDNGTVIAEKLGVPETVIALTFVALGTSLPELVTAITSLAKGHGSLSLGNIIGANIFNLVLVSGMSIALAPFEVPLGNTVAGYNSSLIIDIPLMITVMALLIIPALCSKKLSRYQGIILLVLYGGFCALQFIL